VTQVLDLAAVFERDTVKMPDGTQHELRNPQELGILEEHRLRLLLKKIEEFTAGAKSEQDAEQASKLLRELATMLVVDLEAEIPDWACVAIFQFWVKRVEGEEKPANPRKPRTTAGSSRGSKRSTAATPKRGSTTRPGS
jgi:hypothetical protein